MSGKTKLDIVRDGLVLYIDAANSLSYKPDNPNYAYNINNATGPNKLITPKYLTPAERSNVDKPTYEPINLGVWNFDGTQSQSFAITIDNSFTTTYPLNYGSYSGSTINFWINFNSFSTDGERIIFVDNWIDSNFTITEIWNGSDSSVGFILATHNVGGYTFNPTTLFTNQWYNIAFTDSGISGSQNPIYIASITDNGRIAVDTYYSTGSVRLQDKFSSISGFYYKNATSLDAKISNFSIYNRVLSSEEVEQNYNALKYRFL